MKAIAIGLLAAASIALSGPCERTHMGRRQGLDPGVGRGRLLAL
jgi:hypothetical protein